MTPTITYMFGLHQYPLNRTSSTSSLQKKLQVISYVLFYNKLHSYNLGYFVEVVTLTCSLQLQIILFSFLLPCKTYYLQMFNVLLCTGLQIEPFIQIHYQNKTTAFHHFTYYKTMAYYVLYIYIYIYIYI